MTKFLKRFLSFIAASVFFAAGATVVIARPRTDSYSSDYGYYDDYGDYGYYDDYGDYGYYDGYGDYGYYDGYGDYDDAYLDELYSIIDDFLFDYEPDYEYTGSDWDEVDYSAYSHSYGYDDDYDDYYSSSGASSPFITGGHGSSSGNNTGHSSSGGSSNSHAQTASTNHPSNAGGQSSTAPTSTVSNQRKQFIEYALSLRGTPYVYGGKTPKPGLDCSGFVAFAARKAINVNFTGSAQNMYNNSSKVNTNNAEPGDLLFFSDNGSSISHVGIYLGRNGMGGNNDRMFVHSASEGSSTGVIVSSLDKAGYWSKHFVGVKSFLPTTSSARAKTRSKGLNPITSLQSSKKEFANDKWWDDVDESWFKD